MQNTRLREFLIKLLLFTMPIWLLVGIYIIADPFKVIFHYSSYHPAKGVAPIILNEDFVSTQTLLNNYKETRPDSYIFGNSRSGHVLTADWKNHIGNKNCYHFDAWGEGIYGIEKKVWLLDSLGCQIDNALLILDNETLGYTENRTGQIYIKHPVLSGQSWYYFEMEFFKTFFNPRYMLPFFDYMISGKYKEYMKDVMSYAPSSYSVKENEYIYYWADSMLAQNPEKYYQVSKVTFYQRPDKEQIAPAVIAEKQRVLLENIKNIFDKHHTQVRVIISPLYDQVKFNENDLACLKRQFGADNVFDFSGINKMTADYHNYYETSHFRPMVGAQMLDSAYAENSWR
jgi:hypothetical protein